MALKESNPFERGARPRESARPGLRRRGVFSRARPHTRFDVIADNKLREAERQRLGGYEHLHSVTDLRDFLSTLPGGVEACASAFKCDPWKYEPLMLDELIRELEAGSDPTRINEIRGLIRAGSWMTYERTGQQGALERLQEIQRLEQEDWRSRVRAAERESDMQTARELQQELDDILKQLREAADALRQGRLGDDLEAAARAVENLNARAWLELKRVMSIHGWSLEDARRHPVARPLIQEIERLRPVRDLLYFRRIYPKWAEKSLP